MPPNPPGTTVNIGTAGPYSNTGAPTGTWFVLGQAQGPSGVAVPVNSMNDFSTYFGSIVNSVVQGRYTYSASVDSTLLYDALDVYFREGGIRTYVSRVCAAAAVVATSATGAKFQFTAAGGGTWANSSSGTGSAGLVISISAATVGSNVVYSVQVLLNGNLIAASPGLGADLDVVNWINSLPLYQSLCTATYSAGGTSTLPSSGTTVSIYVGTGSGATAGTDASAADTDIPAALNAFAVTLGPGQVSYPGHTTALGYADLTQHAMAYNRVAFLDGVNTATTGTLTAAVTTLATTALTDGSYAAMFAPWLTCPGVANANPAGTAGAVFARTVAPSALAAARVAANDTVHDSNNPAAGVGSGTSVYATGVTQTYTPTNEGLLNAGGVNLIKVVTAVNQVTIYGFRSCSYDPNWVYLNNVRFRMQAVNDFSYIAEGFVFEEIDGRGQLFGRFNGALAGKCNQYWLHGSIYGASPADAFTVNTGPQVNTTATIAAGELIAQVNLRMAPFAEYVIINVVKYTISAPLPTSGTT
jgi:hypothetical protein